MPGRDHLSKRNGNLCKFGPFFGALGDSRGPKNSQKLRRRYFLGPTGGSGSGPKSVFWPSGVRNPFQLNFWSIFGPLGPLRNTAHGSKFEGFQVCKTRLKNDPKSRPRGPHFRVFTFFHFFFGPKGDAKNPGSAIFVNFWAHQKKSKKKTLRP